MQALLSQDRRNSFSKLSRFSSESNYVLSSLTCPSPCLFQGQDPGRKAGPGTQQQPLKTFLVKFKASGYALLGVEETRLKGNLTSESKIFLWNVQGDFLTPAETPIAVILPLLPPHLRRSVSKADPLETAVGLSRAWSLDVPPLLAPFATAFVLSGASLL